MNFFRRFGGILVAVGGVMALGIGIYLILIIKSLPDIDNISSYIPAETTKIYSADGVILAELHKEENRILVPIDRISKPIQETVVAMEDTDFYSHHGVNIKGMFRALWIDIKARAFVQGGSTLTQQLARNLFLEKRKKIRRKIEEILLAIQIERKYTKTEILEMYLNQVYWGHNAYGIESASQMYFGKHASDISLAEAAMLIGMLTAPELYSPFRNMPLTKKRQKIVLNRMKKVGIISAAEARKAYNEPLLIAKRKRHRYKAPFFSSYVVKQLLKMYGDESIYTAGLKVYTTLNYELQQVAEKVVQKYVDIGNREYWIKGEKVPSLNYNQAAILAVDPRNGFVRVMQGGVDFKSNEFNRVTQAKRQPGSAFKPFVYLTALKKGFSPGSIIEDSPVTFNTIEGPYSPQNYTKKFSGPIPMRKALEKSINVVAIRLNDFVGPKTVVRTAYDLGVKSNLSPILSLPLGANEVTMLELASVYGVFANRGIRVEPTAIVEIKDRHGISIYKHKIEEKQVYDSDSIAALVEMMEGIVNYGTGRAARLGRPVAGKTGTTSDYKDAWFVGFTPQIVTAAWVGNDDNISMNNVTGGWIPAQMWKAFMQEMVKDMPVERFPRARGMVVRKIDWTTGLLAGDYGSDDDKVTAEKFWRGREPSRRTSTFGDSGFKKRKEQDREDQEMANEFLNFNM